MSERQEKKRRYNQKLEYIAKFVRWIDDEPPLWRVIAWKRWRDGRPRIEEQD